MLEQLDDVGDRRDVVASIRPARVRRSRAEPNLARPTDETLRVGIIGCGGIAHEHLQALRHVDGADVSVVCDTSPAIAAFVADLYGVQRVATSADELLAGPDRPDIVHLLTPPHTHEPLVRAALSAGCHVVCEKPLAPTEESARDLFGHARACGALLYESQNMRFNDVIGRFDRLVESGRLGDVREVDVTLQLDLADGPFGDMHLSGPGVRLPGGALQDLLPHLAYLLLHLHGLLATPTADGPRRPPRRHLVGDPVVVGSTANRSANARVGLDAVDALVRLAVSGDEGNDFSVRGRLHVVSDVGPDAFRVTVRGSRSTVTADLYQPFLRVEGPPDVGVRSSIEQIRSGAGLIVAGCSNFLGKVRRRGPMHGLTVMLQQIVTEISAGVGAGTSDESVLTARLVDELVSLPREHAEHHPQAERLRHPDGAVHR